MLYTLNNTNFLSNTFLSDSKELTELIFDGRIVSYLPEESSFQMTNSSISSNSLLVCSYSTFLVNNNCPSESTVTSKQAEKTYLLTFDYLSNVTLVNIITMDNSLTFVNYIKTLSFIVNGLTCGNSYLNSSGNDNSCIRISEFSKINLTILNS